MKAHHTGLTKAQVLERRKRYGLNELEKKSTISVGVLLLNQFTSPLMLVLLGALGLSILLGDFVDVVVIMLAIGINVLLGFWQEYKAERSLEALARVIRAKATVIREGIYQEIDVSDLVPGDLIRLTAGERIPADAVLLEGSGLTVNEAILTGESMPVTKLDEGRVSDFIGIEERKRARSGSVSLYGGTTVLSGMGIASIVKTGMETEMGAIALKLLKTQTGQSPLQKKLTTLSKRISGLVLMISICLLILGWLKGMNFGEMVMVAVAVAVAAVPEGLAISLTAILAVGMQRILRRKALVRKMLAAEVLGSVSVICTDKTGTLTEGMMRVHQVISDHDELMTAAGVASAGGGDQLETAWWQWIEEKKGSAIMSSLQAEYEIMSRLPFTSEKKYSATLTTKEIFTVGAPESILQLTDLTMAKRVLYMKEVERYARRGYRVVAVAHRKRQSEKRLSHETMRGRFFWLGIVVFEDKVREGLVHILREVVEAGIAIKVITGDYGETAVATCKRLGMEIEPYERLDGDELSRMDSSELAERVMQTKLFARTSPSQKLMIVNALQENGEVVAMTGDGVNDAPALKRADIGIVVANASEVAKETADMVLLDSNFATIVAAIEEGRGIYKNLRKVLLYLLSDSMTQVLLVMGALLLGLPIPLITAQVLWVNLISDSLPALALTVDPHLTEMMNKPPRKPTEPLINQEMSVLIAIISFVSALVVFVSYVWLLSNGYTLSFSRTYAFSLMAISCLLYVFSSRSLKTPLYKDKPWRNPWLVVCVGVGLILQVMAVYVPVLQRLLGTQALPLLSWTSIGIISVIIIGVIEAVKTFYWRSEKNIA